MLKNTCLPPSRQEHERRVWFLAANLVETMRPVVEGALPESFLLDHIIQQCDRLKRLPLGAQILRCIGRAYRYSGKRILRRHHHRQRKKTSTIISGLLPVALQDSMRDKLREAKHIATAALAGGRVVLEERVSSSITNNRVEASRDTDPHRLLLESSVMPDQHVDDFCYQPPSDAEIKESEQRKAREALLQSLQVEALWKICKIDLDRTIREACDLILEGEYFFFPSHYLTQQQQQQPPNYHSSSDGWIGSSGIAVTTDVGRIRAASLLYSMGEIMVKRSKEGTAWME